MKIKTIIIPVLAFAALAFCFNRADAAGATSGILLRQDVFAQSTALGEAFTAYPGAVACVYYNPAGLYAVGMREAVLSYSTKLFDTQLGFAGYAMAFKNSALVIGYSYLDTGKEQFDFDYTASITRTALNETLISVSYGGKVAEGFACGATVKQFASTLAGEYAANTVTADAGIMVFSKEPGLVFGAGVRNVSGSLTYSRQSEKLPQQTRVGLSYLFKFDNDPDLVRIRNFEKSGRFLVDSVQDAELGSVNSIGFESIFGYGSFRAGYKTGTSAGASGLYAGLGFVSDRGVNLDYAFSRGGELGSAHTLTLRIKW
ncbi:MAG: hypothetical protein A2297_04760 [Elusimicrobia bacterium RIFOXYB2_FULL_48_7]|nr:MAG: hypothetical protein A2297_04760 [Elusimicrobia bacterium RIFOXYB2_FULL_48_7]